MPGLRVPVAMNVYDFQRAASPRIPAGPPVPGLEGLRAERPRAKVPLMTLNPEEGPDSPSGLRGIHGGTIVPNATAGGLYRGPGGRRIAWFGPVHRCQEGCSQMNEMAGDQPVIGVFLLDDHEIVRR